MQCCRSFSIYARAMGLENRAPNDMRRTCAKLCRKRGGDLDQVKFLSGHASIQTTERYFRQVGFQKLRFQRQASTPVRETVVSADFQTPSEKNATWP